MRDDLLMWGVDPSTRRVSIAWAGREQGVATQSFNARLQGGERLWHIYSATYRLARQLPAPDRILVEQPFGHNVPPISQWAMATIMTACWRATGAPAHPIPVPSWKLRAVGRGNANKHDVMTWARQNGYTGTLQDEADAWAIAHAALHDNAPAAIQA